MTASHSEHYASFTAPGTLPSVHTLYQDPTIRHRWTTEPPKDIGPPAQNATSEQYALAARYVPTTNNPCKDFDLDVIVVQSQILKSIIARGFDGYSGFTLGFGRVEFSKPFDPFVRRWERLVEARDQLLAETTMNDRQHIVAHFDLLRSTLYRELAPILDERQAMLDHHTITFKLVWSIFEPGCLVYTSKNGHDQLYRVKEIVMCQAQCKLECEFVDYDGKIFGLHKKYLSVACFCGTKKITQLEAYPLGFHEDLETLRDRLISRGRTFEAYKGTHFVAYNGAAFGSDRTKLSINSRIMIDSAASIRYKMKLELEPFGAEPLPKSRAGFTVSRYDPRRDGPNTDEDCVDLGSPYNASKKDAGKRPTVDPTVESGLTTEQLLLASSRVRGFSFRDKQWLEFFIDNIQDVVWNDDAFKALVAPPEQKELILAFAEAQAKDRTGFDDVIQGKGKGIIMLLSGPPGVGKTLTAESVAEAMRVPLYAIGAAELGSKTLDLETALEKVLKVCTRWNAILLLDEADVFMQSRDSKSLERNKLVAIFLRLLEYFEGILFLTTNRLEDMDPAFESRIHLSLNYAELDKTSRRQIWLTFLDRISKTNHTPAFTEAELDGLSKVPLNGRQIRNTLKTAQLLADRYDDCLNMSHIDTVLKLRKANEKKTIGFFGASE